MAGLWCSYFLIKEKQFVIPLPLSTSLHMDQECYTSYCIRALGGLQQGKKYKYNRDIETVMNVRSKCSKSGWETNYKIRMKNIKLCNNRHIEWNKCLRKSKITKEFRDLQQETIKNSEMSQKRKTANIGGNIGTTGESACNRSN